MKYELALLTGVDKETGKSIEGFMVPRVAMDTVVAALKRKGVPYGKKIDVDWDILACLLDHRITLKDNIKFQIEYSVMECRSCSVMTDNGLKPLTPLPVGPQEGV